MAKEYNKNPAAVGALSPEQDHVTQKYGTDARSAPSVAALAPRPTRRTQAVGLQRLNDTAVPSALEAEGCDFSDD